MCQGNAQCSWSKCTQVEERQKWNRLSCIALAWIGASLFTFAKAVVLAEALEVEAALGGVTIIRDPWLCEPDFPGSCADLVVKGTPNIDPQNSRIP